MPTNKKQFIVTLGYKKLVFPDMDTAIKFMNMAASATFVERDWEKQKQGDPCTWKVVEIDELSASYEDIGDILNKGAK